MKLKILRTLSLALVLVTAAFALAGCESDATVASRNISKAADMFEVNRRIVFINGITDKYLLSIEGRCSQEQTERKLVVTCKTGPNQYKKHFLVLSDNVTAVSEQLDGISASVYMYRVVFRPTTIIPNIDVRVPGLTKDE